MKKLTKAIKEAEVRLEMAEKHDLDIGYYKGYLKALKDVDNKTLSFNSKVDKAMKDKCIKEYELVKLTGLSRQSVNKIRIEGRFSKTKAMIKIAKALDVNVEDILEDK